MQTVLVFILVLSILVFIHELGHFIFAKRAGILVREFAIGFGPKVFSKVYGETLYAIRILPLGGYVRMAGEDVEAVDIKTGSLLYLTFDETNKVKHVYLYEPNIMTEKVRTGRLLEADLEDGLYVQMETDQGEERFDLHEQALIHYDQKNWIQVAPKDRQFGSKTVGQKAMTIFAGPLFNVILTAVLLSVFSLMVGAIQQNPLKVGEVLPDTPAERAGIKTNDAIIRLDGKSISKLEDLQSYLTKGGGEPVTVTVERDQQTLEFQLTPQQSEGKYYIGIDPARTDVTFLQAISNGVTDTYDYSIRIMEGFGMLLTGQLGVKDLGGPIQMGSITGQAVEQGIEKVVLWTALLSLNLGIFNLLPIPALDGSRLVFIGIEAVRGKPISPNREGMVHFVGFALLMVLMLVVTYNDIMRLFF
ncbi:RIP metalloprotease RseP [Hazenella sp. IB182357]|uniref:Zinc metalloprotease n=1 Tax=Polycladospora coralii TaxID=2771432 RepID=A0A926N563_9BACL|nr:RIP metalloprotease RseP [Polycladospora coralii]MBD1371479.1 RIP metalloprotease RseP [Polycladospora coralii]MBS7530447.1 RIP metalloprotease RseP [Polycladospora coralii]